MWDKVERSEFDNYKREVWERHEASISRLLQIERLLAEKTPELVDELREILNKASVDQSIVRKAAEDSEAIFKLLEQEQAESAVALAPLSEEIAKARDACVLLKQQIDEVQLLRGELLGAKAKSDALVIEVASNLEQAKVMATQADDVPAKLDAASKLVGTCETLRDNIQGIADHSIARKASIDEVYNEVFGQELKSSDGAVDRIDGLREKLRKAFDSADGALTTVKERAAADVSGITTQLKALMPGAMAAGLSAAYEAKANSETDSQRKLERQFILSICGLAAVSLIPFGVDIYLLTEGKELIEVLRQTPVLPIIPLYFPVLWLAYSTSKKVNLSKRLIEEYTHKAVLGKTFSGLSNQIDSLPKDHEVTQELRLRLLYNVLQVSAENPGKLITDYNKADHPVMEALENSSRLSGSIDAIQRIPGFTKLAEWLASRQVGIASAQAERVASGLDAAESLLSKAK